MSYNYQLFQNVATKEDFLGNIKNVAVANGWICDKDSIAASGELYLHSLGNGNQNLYYSFKVQVITLGPCNSIAPVLTAFSIFANTGFNTSLAVDAQPGKWAEIGIVYAIYCNYFNDFSLLGFPINTQYVFANNQMVLCFADIFTSVFSPGVFWNPRYVKHLGFGAIDSYKGSAETEGNYFFTDHYYLQRADNFKSMYSNIFMSSILGTYLTQTSYKNNAGLLYAGANRFDINCGVSTPYVISISDSIYDNTEDTYATYGRRGYRYNWAIQYNSWASRFSLIKPIMSITYTDATNIFFYPIGELPYYACKAYPYTQTGNIIYYGTRKFMTFPILNSDNARGVAVEIN